MLTPASLASKHGFLCSTDSTSPSSPGAPTPTPPPLAAGTPDWGGAEEGVLTCKVVELGGRHRGSKPGRDRLEMV